MDDDTTTAEQAPAPVAPAADAPTGTEAYLFPTYGITVEASSLEDANAKLQDQLKTK
jgi:hypothetical protein